MRTKRKILTAGFGIAAMTALEGLACGNPVAPACPSHKSCYPEEQPVTQPIDAAPADAGVPDVAPDADLSDVRL